MKRKNIFFVASLILFGLLTIQSCKVEDPTTFVTKSTNAIPVATSPIVAADGTVFFTGSTVDLSWTSENKGVANKYTVYFGTTKSGSVFKSNLVDTKVTVPVADGNTYYWKVETIDANGIVTTSPVFSFIAIDGSNPKFTVSLVCTTDVLSSIGVDLKSKDVVDLRFLILKKSDLSIVKVVDTNGEANEVYRDFQLLPDGDYVLGVDLASATNFGDLSTPVNLSYSLNFLQKGIMNTTYDYPNVVTNEHTLINSCSIYWTKLATVKKAGSAYTVARDVKSFPAATAWAGKDDAYASVVTTNSTCTETSMTGLGFGWMGDYWGEIITSGGTLIYTTSGNTITIPLQKYCKTTYKGAAQPEYSIQGTGTIDNTGAFPIWTIHYDFLQSGSTILTKANGVPLGYLEAKITTNPAGLAAVKQFIVQGRRPNR